MSEVRRPARGRCSSWPSSRSARSLVWLVAVGMFLLSWRLEAPCIDKAGAELVRKRVSAAGKAVLYGALGVERDPDRDRLRWFRRVTAPTPTTAKLMDLPAGQALVVAVGVGDHRLRRLPDREGAGPRSSPRSSTPRARAATAARRTCCFGKIGYVAKGIAVGIVGALFVYAGVTHEADKSGGLDQALYEVLDQPFGPVLLGAIAIGIGCFGLFCFARALRAPGALT